MPPATAILTIVGSVAEFANLRKLNGLKMLYLINFSHGQYRRDGSENMTWDLIALIFILIYLYDFCT